jgi:2',3'-cyclic-nucleotide 2'-phosphodiesterase (5'-nucleotidase family)
MLLPGCASRDVPRISRTNSPAMMAHRLTIALILFCLTAIHSVSVAAAGRTTITLLFTNDVESAYDPIPAFWLEDQEMIGGIAEMTTLINRIRDEEPNVFLFDSGDIFTGALAKLTEGRLAFELMITMGYDAMAIGNHEFEYGHEIFAWQKNRAPFPVLGANFFYKGTDHPYAQAHAIIERNGVRIGVIGIMGQDAVSAIIPSFIEPLDVTVPAG